MRYLIERVEESRTVTTSAKEREAQEKGKKKSASKWVTIAALEQSMNNLFEPSLL